MLKDVNTDCCSLERRTHLKSMTREGVAFYE